MPGVNGKLHVESIRVANTNYIMYKIDMQCNITKPVSSLFSQLSMQSHRVSL